jgi:hypothetical protein
MKMKNPITLIGKIISGGGSEIIAEAGQKIDERDVLNGLTIDVVGAFADNFQLRTQIVDGGFVTMIERKAK